MLKTENLLVLVLVVLFGCSNPNAEKKVEIKKDSVEAEIAIAKVDTVKKDAVVMIPTNDTLNAMANIMAGIKDSSTLYHFVQASSDFKNFSRTFDKRWSAFDSTRLNNLRKFKENELSKIVKRQTTLFYPFSGPDVLYSQTFFPDADNYVMIGLEPVGSFPTFIEEEKDSLDLYFSKVNTSLNAILKFSFFRTESMSKDLKNEEVDGTLHLLFLFLKRTKNNFCSAKPITVDSLGNIKFASTFEALKKTKTNTRGIEIQFLDAHQQLKKLHYFSLNAADGGLKYNKGFRAYLNNMGTVNTYLKGASYLMHKNYFSMIRHVILNQSQQIIQDDSGIALHYFLEDSHQWDFNFYGKYVKPIPMFSAFYQKDLDSLYILKGAIPIGFGIGYNFKDKSSNMMIASKKM